MLSNTPASLFFRNATVMTKESGLTKNNYVCQVGKTHAHAHFFVSFLQVMIKTCIHFC